MPLVMLVPMMCVRVRMEVPTTPADQQPHASAHTVAAEQYTPENALVAILLVTGLLSELAYWYGQAAEAELPQALPVAVS
jgi:uncharacterized membrane protein